MDEQILEIIKTTLADLRARVEALEEKLVKRPGEDCPFCGEPALRLTFQGMNAQLEQWTCGECGNTKEIRHDLVGKNARRVR